jgi:hypothetical protein
MIGTDRIDKNEDSARLQNNSDCVVIVGKQTLSRTPVLQ